MKDLKLLKNLQEQITAWGAGLEAKFKFSAAFVHTQLFTLNCAKFSFNLKDAVECIRRVV